MPYVFILCAVAAGFTAATAPNKNVLTVAFGILSPVVFMTLGIREFVRQRKSPGHRG
jgi:hypothetical protein